MKSMGERIKETRIAKGLSQEELGAMIGIQKSGIAKYENGRVQQISPERLERLAIALGVTVDYLTANMERDLLALDVEVNHTAEGFVVVSDMMAPELTVQYTEARWAELEADGPEGFKTVWDDLADKKRVAAKKDADLDDYLEMLKNRPECRMLFSLAKDATKEDVERAVAIIEALRSTEGR